MLLCFRAQSPIPAFTKTVKKIHANAKQDLDEAIKELIKNPLAGELKKET